METREFLRRYAWVYLYVAAFFLAAAGVLRHTVEQVGSMAPFSSYPVIVIDAGHGAPDGGSTGISGTREEAVNLAVAKRLEGVHDPDRTRLHRHPGGIHTPEKTVRPAKQSRAGQ